MSLTFYITWLVFGSADIIDCHFAQWKKKDADVFGVIILLQTLMLQGL